MPRDKIYASYGSLAPKQEDKPVYSVLEIQDLQHRKKTLSGNSIVCVDLFADWCAPCKVVAPKFAELAQQYNNPGRCLLAKENFDLKLTRDYQITGIPAFIFYRGGHLLRTTDGKPVSVVGDNIDQVKTILDKLLSQG